MLAAFRYKQPGNVHGRSPRLDRAPPRLLVSAPRIRGATSARCSSHGTSPRHTGKGIAYRVLVEPASLGEARLPSPHVAGRILRSDSEGSRSQPAGVLFGLGIQVCVKCSRISRSRRSRGIKLAGDAMFDLATTLRHLGSLMMPTEAP